MNIIESLKTDNYNSRKGLNTQMEQHGYLRKI